MCHACNAFSHKVPNGMQAELARNRCRSQRIDVWQQAVDTDVFNPVFRSAEMRARMSGGRPDAVILTYVGRLGAGALPMPPCIARSLLLRGPV